MAKRRTLRDLASDMENLADALPGELNDIKINAAMHLLGFVAYETPVDKSRALSNWQVTIGSPAASYREAHVIGTHGSTFEASVNRTIQVGRARAEQVEPGTSLFVVNRAPYIAALERGRSRQNSGFVQRGIESLDAFLLRQVAGDTDG